MDSSTSLPDDLSHISVNLLAIRRSPAQRRENSRDTPKDLMVISEETAAAVAQFWEQMENDVEVWNTAHPFQSVIDGYPNLFNIVKAYRAMQSGSKDSLRTIRDHWGNAAYAFVDKKYDMLKYVAQCAPYQTSEWCEAKISEIIEDRLQNPHPGISTSKDPQNRDWMKLADFLKKNRSPCLASSQQTFSAQDVGKRQEEGGTEEKGREEERHQEKRREERRTEVNRNEEKKIQEEEFRTEEDIQDKESHNEEEEIQGDDRHNEEEGIQGNEHHNQEEPQHEERDNMGDDLKEEQPKVEERSNKRKPQPLTNNRKRAKQIECSCDPYPVGPSKQWKTEMEKAKNDEYDIGHRTLLLSAIAWGDFAACPAHLKMLENFLGLKPQPGINSVKAGLRKYWEARYNVEGYIQQYPHLFVSGAHH